MNVNIITKNRWRTVSADTLTNEGTIDNAGTMNVADGTNSGTITGEGTTNVTGDFTNSSSMEQGTVTVGEDGKLTNTEDGTLSAGTLTNDGTVVNAGTANVTDTFTNNGTTENDGTLTVKDGTNTGSITGEGTTNTTGNFTNNSTISTDVVNTGNLTNGRNSTISGDVTNENGGDIKNSGTMSGAVNNDENSTIESHLAGITGQNGDVTNHGTITFTSADTPIGTTITDIKGDGRVVLDVGDNSYVTLNNDLFDNTLALNSGTLIFGSQTSVAGFEANGGTINTANGVIEEIVLGAVTGTGTTNLILDFDLSSGTTDIFSNTGVDGGSFNVLDVRVSGSTNKSKIRIHIGDTTTLGQDNVTSVTKKLPTIKTPIRTLKGTLEDGYITYAAAGSGANSYNPSILAAPVATAIGGYLGEVDILHNSFYHMERYTKYTQADRRKAEMANIYANNDTSVPTYIREKLPETSQAMWVEPFTTFEKVDLRGGLKVSNISYGALYGGDTDLKDLGHGFKGIISAFIGYNGNNTSYRNIDINQQGGVLGVTGTLYKGNFFTGVTVSTGASTGEASLTYGTDRFTMLTAGIANRTGYNFEMAQGKFIIQPSLFMAYVFVNTFDYKNAAGVSIDSDPLHALQIAPGIKFIGNLENGWQPYFSVDMVWNTMGHTHVMAAESKLPEFSVKPFVQYGLGIQKSWSDNFTAYMQAMVRNGGRTGVALSAGFRWTVGKKYKPSKERKVIKSKDGSAVTTSDGIMMKGMK